MVAEDGHSSIRPVVGKHLGRYGVVICEERERDGERGGRRGRERG